MSLVFLLGEMGNTEHSNGGFRKCWECACVRVCGGARTPSFVLEADNAGKVSQASFC